MDKAVKYTIESFKERVSYGNVNNNMGMGFFGTENEESYSPVMCDTSYIDAVAKKHGYTHIYWYEK